MYTPITKKAQQSCSAGMARATAKQTSESGGVMGKLREIDANIDRKIQTANVKPAAEPYSFQHFVNDGPAPFIRKGIEMAGEAWDKMTGSDDDDKSKK